MQTIRSAWSLEKICNKRYILGTPITKKIKVAHSLGPVAILYYFAYMKIR